MERESSRFISIFLFGLIIAAGALLLGACGGGGGPGSESNTIISASPSPDPALSTTTPYPATSGGASPLPSDQSTTGSYYPTSATQVTGGIAVDPYLVGATFFEDANGNGRWDPGEQISTPSDERGRFNFTNPIVPGRTIIMLERGLHQGVPFTGRLMRRVEADDPATVVVSPLTTYVALGQDPTNLAAPLRFLNDSYTSDYNITADPMAGLAAITAYQPADQAAIADLRANLYIGAVLDLALLHQELPEISGQDFQSKLTYWNPLPDFISGLRYAVSAGALDRINSQLPGGISDLPPVSMREVAETMPAIINWWKQELIRKAIELQDPLITAAELEALVERVQGELGLHYYLRNHRDHPAVQREISARRLPAAPEGHALVRTDGSVGPVQVASWQNELPGQALALGNSSRLRFFPPDPDGPGATELTYRGDNGEIATVAGTWRIADNHLILTDSQSDTLLFLEMETSWSSHLSLRIKDDQPYDPPPFSFVGRLLKEARQFRLAEG
jgi:hypothetical protein